MIDLDKYLNATIEFKLDGQIIRVKQPTALATKKIGNLEAGAVEENYLDSRCEITQIILNNNEDGKKFTVNEVEKIPFKVQDLIIKKISEMVFEAENDPN